MIDTGLPVTIFASINGAPAEAIGQGFMRNPKTALADVATLLRTLADALENEARFGEIAESLRDLDIDDGRGTWRNPGLHE